MRCLSRTTCSKIKQLLILYVIVGISVVLIVCINHQPWIYQTRKNANTYRFSSKYPGSFLKEYKPNNESYCNFMYNLPEEFSYEDSDLEFGPELGVRSPYRVLYNVVRAKQNASRSAPVTYATHLTPDFLGYVTEVARYWEGPISVAAFVPDSDADLLTKHLVQLCQCLPAMSKVSVHYVFPKHHVLYVGKPLTPPSTCSISDQTKHLTFRNRKSLLYPINTCRNVARNASTTNFVLVSDVELLPSRQLTSRFAAMLTKLADINFPSRVFVVPVFEIESYENVPTNKNELLRLIKQEKAVYFHRHICSHCQKFPGIEKWLHQDPGNVIKLFAATTRVFPYHRWEPVYIGTKNEPFYSEVLSWEGKQDKMTQMLEMCLMGYRFLILDGAFLVHWPGIKRKSIAMRERNSWRSPYQLRNSRQYNNILKKLAANYKTNPRCKMQ